MTLLTPYRRVAVALLALATLSVHADSSPQGAFDIYQQDIPGTDLRIAMVPITGGTYSMGSPANEADRNDVEGPQHNVSVADFWIGQYEVNWQQYEVFVHRDDSFNELVASEELANLGIDGVTGATAPYMEMSMGMGKDSYPVINITQYAALNYARWLSAKTGYFFRLPTEAEWEYACRAGSDTAWSFGASANNADTYAVHKNNSDGAYAKTGSRQANAWQLYDMHGNVAEWTMDAYDANFYQASGQDNPWNRPEALYPRSVRGGSWMHDIRDARCAARMGSSPAWKDFDPQIPRSLWWHTSAPFIGFRLVRPRIQPSPKEIKAYWLDAIEDYGT